MCILRHENNLHQKLTCPICVVGLLYWYIYMNLQVMYAGDDCSCDIVLTVIIIFEWLPILNITRVSVCGFLLSVSIATITILHLHLHPTLLCVILFWGILCIH